MLREDKLKLQLLQKILVCWYVPGNCLIFFSSFFMRRKEKSWSGKSWVFNQNEGSKLIFL